MSTTNENFDYGWRRPAPIARLGAKLFYSWQEPGWSFFYGVCAALPFLAAAALAPALLSLAPTVEMIAPIADAKAIAAGEASIIDHASPLYAMLLLAAEFLTGTPGRAHLVSKVFGAILVVYPFCYIASSRFPIIPSSLMAGALAAFVAAPFSDASELGLAIMIVCAVTFLSASADESGGRARFEGFVGGVMLFALWTLNPIYSLAGFLFLSACPFMTGRGGLLRYAATLATFALLAGLAELAAPGINIARAEAASGMLQFNWDFDAREGAFGVSGVAFTTIMVVIATAVFGGREHFRAWVSPALLCIIGFVAARIVGANALPVFIVAASIACFSVASPFYDGIFQAHDRASVALSSMAAALSVFWAAALIVHSGGQFVLQHQVTKAAPENIRTELALVQPGGPTIARWVEEGRFSTPEARELFALAPVDQSTMLLEAASRARDIARQGVDVAILTEADTACILAAKRRCEGSGRAAATKANIVFVPRLEIDPQTESEKGRSEAMLYTEFKLVEQTALWEIWARRGATLPQKVFNTQSGMLYR